MFKKVLVSVDVSDPAETQKLLAATKSLTEGWGSEMHVVTVVPDVGMAIVGSYFDKNFEEESRKIATEQLEAAVSAAGIDTKTHVKTGSVYDVVIELSSALGVNLIVVGAQQPDLRDYLLGTNAARILRHSNQSVLLLRNL